MKKTTTVTPADEDAAKVSRRKNIALAAMIVAVIVVGSSALAYALIGQREHGAAVDELHDALDGTATILVDLDAQTSARQDAVANAAAEAAALSSIIDLLPADLVDPASTRDAAVAAATTLSVTAAAPAPPLDASAPAAVDVDVDAATTSQLTDAVEQARQRAGLLVTQRNAVASDTATIVQAITAARASRDGLIAAAIAKAPSIPVDRAGETERTNFNAGFEGLKGITVDTTSTDALPVVKAYADALGAARASHDAAIAAELEAQRQAAEQEQTGSNGSNGSGGGSGRSSSRGSSGGGSSNSGGGGGSSNGGGGSSNGGGGSSNTSDGGSSGGGSSSAPSWQPMKLIRGGVSCLSSDINGQEVTYGSTLMVPSDAASYSTYEVAGYGWGVTWSCF